MSRRLGLRRLLDALLGLVYVALALGLVAGALAVYNKAFTDSTDVVLETGALGNSLQKGSDVQLNGVPVGRVTSISATGKGARLELALDPAAAGDLPKHTVARLLPKTLFGERYVQLVPGAQGAALEDGDVIRQDRSAAAVELEEVFDELLPTLRAIQPAKLAATLGELSIALRGQGEAMGDSMVAWGNHLEKLNPHVPAMTQDLQLLAQVAREYDAAVPDLLTARDTLSTTSHTMVDQQTQLRDLYASVVASSDSTAGWVRANHDTIDILSAESRRALRVVSPYARQFPCTFRALRKFVPVMDKTLGQGTDQPGVHVRLNVVKSRGKYLPGKDAVTYESGGKARCPYITGDDARGGEPPSIPAPPNRALSEHLGNQTGSAAGLGEANSPAENQLISELLAGEQGHAPDDYPDWASLVVGPTLRGAQVVIQ